MKNRAFQVQSEVENQRKLEVVLRQLSGDRLTGEQRRLIGEAIGFCRQYSFRLCRPPSLPTISSQQTGGYTAVRTIFGNLEGRTDEPAAALVRCSAQGEEQNTVYIYLPVEKEEQRDEPRKEKVPDQ